jgi:putative ABC transport system permease protein
MKNAELMKHIVLGFKLALRELRSGLKGFNVFTACLALGVAAVACVNGLNVSVERGLSVNARSILAGDMEVRLQGAGAQKEAFAFMQSMGDVSEYVAMRAMARPEKSAGRAAVSELKAIDAAYPLYGEVLTASGRDIHTFFAQAQSDAGEPYPALVERSMLLRLNAEVGDIISLGAGTFRIADVIEREPEKTSQFFGLAPRVMIPLSALPATELVRPGSVLRYIYKIKLPGTADLKDAKSAAEDLRQAFPEAGWRIRTFDQAGSQVRRFFGDLSSHLTLVGLSALLIGGLGVAAAVRAHLSRKYTTIAAMKSMGAVRAQVTSTYLMQTLLLAAMATLLGLILGVVITYAAGLMLQLFLGVPVQSGIHMSALLPAGIFGMLTAMVFALPPLSAAGRISPAGLFRGYSLVDGSGPGWKVIAATCLCALALYLFLIAYSQNKPTAAGFGLAFLITAFAFHFLGKAVMWAAARLPRPGSPRLRQAIANLHRPGASTPGVVFSIGMGLTVLTAVLSADANLQNRIQRQLPEQAPSFFFLDIRNSQMEAFRQAVTSMPGVERFESTPSLRARIVKVNGVPADKAQIDPEFAWALRGERGLTYSAEMSDKINVTQGAWWPEDYAGPPIICFGDAMARGLGLGLGDTITFNVLGREITAEIAALRTIDWDSLSLNHSTIFAPGTLEKAPHSHIATAYAEGFEDEVFAMAAGDFPDVVTVYVKDVLEQAAEIVSDIGVSARAVASVTLVAGLLVLAETLRANLRSRHYDAVIFKVLGATRRDILLSLAYEFLLLGAVSALFATILGSAMAFAFVSFVMKADFVLDAYSLLGPSIGGVFCCLALGLLGVRSAISRKAWPVLRNE